MIRAVQKMLAPIRRRVMLIASRGVIELVDDTPKCQSVQVSALADEVLDEVEHFQSFGFTSVPPKGSECIVLSLGGNRSTSVVLAVGDRRVRLKGLNSGDVAVYNDDGTASIVLRHGGKIEVIASQVNLAEATAADFVALAQKVLDELQSLQTHFAALEGVVAGAPIPEPGNGSPSMLQAALAAAIAASPYPAPSSVAATKVKAT